MISDEEIEYDPQSSSSFLGRYLEDALSESLTLDAVFCREAHGRACHGATVFDLNQQISGLRMARETREASLAMGRRFAALAAALQPCSELARLASHDELHHSVAFGYTLGILGSDPDLAVSAFLHQCVLSTISAGQRLIPLGQIQAGRLAWELKASIIAALRESRIQSVQTVCSCANLPELASMRHPFLPTRLFIS